MELFICKGMELALGEGGELPEWIHVLPLGEWRHPTGPLVVTARDCADIAANFESSGIELVIDYEHQSVLCEKNGAAAPAAGWIDQLQCREDGLWAHVKSWTGRAGEHLRAREYRYLSPVIARRHTDRHTGQPAGKRIPSVALTNIPFFGGDLAPVLARGADPMNFLALVLGALAMPESTTEEQALAEIKRLKEGEGAVSAKAELGDIVCSELKVNAATAKKRIKDVLAHEGFVPVEKHLEALAKADAKAGGHDAHQLLARGIEVGKITPSMKDHFLAYATRDYPAACSWLDSQPIVVATGRSQADPTGKPATAPKLSADEQAMCRTLNLTEAEYLAAKG